MNLTNVTQIKFYDIGGVQRTADTMSIGGTVAWRRPLTLALTKGTGISTIYYKVGNGSWASASGNVTIGYGLTVYMYATASSGYTYSTYTQSNPLTVTMTGAYTYNPVGTVAGFQVTLSKNFTGTLRWSGSLSGTTTNNSQTLTVPSGGSIQVWASCSDGWYHANYNSGNKKSVTSAQTVSFTQSLNSISVNAYGGVLRLNSTILRLKNQSGSDISSGLATGDYMVTGASNKTLQCYVAQGSTGSVGYATGQQVQLSKVPTSNSLYSSVKKGQSWDSGYPSAFALVDHDIALYRSGSGTRAQAYGARCVASAVSQFNEQWGATTYVYYVPNSFTTYNFYNA